MTKKKQTEKKSDHQKILKLERQARQSKPEYKTFDSFMPYTPIPAAGTVAWPVTYSFDTATYMRQGTTDNQRVGDSIKLVSLALRVTALVADAYNILRCVCVLDRNSSGAQPSYNTVFQGVPSTGVVNFMSPLNKTNDHGRFKILADIQFVLATGSGDDSVQMIERYIKLKSRECGFLDDSNTATCLGKNQVYLYMISDSTVISHPIISVWSRLSYTDN